MEVHTSFYVTNVSAPVLLQDYFDATIYKIYASYYQKDKNNN